MQQRHLSLELKIRPMTLHLRVFTVKEIQTAFPPFPFDTKTLKACQMAWKWESFPDESFKYNGTKYMQQRHLSSIFGTKNRAHDPAP
jgi:hypothetical protein